MLVALMGSPAFCTAAMARRTLASVKARGFATTVCFTIEKSAYGVLCGRGPSRLGSESVFGGAPGAISAKERHHWVGRSRVRGDHSATPRNEPVYLPEFEDWLCTEASSGPLSQRTKLARPQSRLPCRKPLQLRSSASFSPTRTIRINSGDGGNHAVTTAGLRRCQSVTV
jgi:hypothetical protein